jgi:hypothetical protein
LQNPDASPQYHAVVESAERMVVVETEAEDSRYSVFGSPKPKLPKAQVAIVG